jgi:DNA-binding helix-hairpin-helix protein with protein kinase domain
MANWLEITNTVINLETLGKVNNLAKAQQQVADQMLAVELRKQRDNAILSQLVDIVVKVRQLLQDNQFLDAVLSSGVGLLAFSDLYSKIIDAETKLKSSDIQIKLVETIRTSVSAELVNRNETNSLFN